MKRQRRRRRRSESRKSKGLMRLGGVEGPDVVRAWWVVVRGSWFEVVVWDGLGWFGVVWGTASFWFLGFGGSRMEGCR